MLAKNDFVFAEGFVVILPATLGAPGFLVITFLKVVVWPVLKLVALITYFSIKYAEES